jgi:ribosome-associated toxin RatA of RatAB toxin-antitoxin module
MRTVEVDARVPGAVPDDVFAAVADFASYPRHTSAVREVRVTETESGIESAWWVTFRNGVLAWTERDAVDAAGRRITFEQVDGDFAVFTGSWSVDQEDGGASVRFAASFDLGMPSLAPMIDPIAERALVDNIRAILTGLLGPAVTFP